MKSAVQSFSPKKSNTRHGRTITACTSWPRLPDIFWRGTRGRVIFLDGRPFSRRYQIENVIAAADSIGQPWRILECVCSEETVRRRLEADNESGSHPAGNRDFQLYAAVKARFEAITHPKKVIDTDQGLEGCVRAAMAALR